MLLRKEEETKMFRHDIRQHMTCIRRLCEQKNYDELEQYLTQMDVAIRELSPKLSVGNHCIEMIIADLMDRYPSVTLDWKGKVPSLSMEAMDVCTLFYNILKNAFEAAHDSAAHSEVCCSVKIQDTNLIIIVSNAYESIKQDTDRNFLTTKSGQGHGYGLKNIAKCVEKYNGSCRITAEDNIFSVEILLPDIAKKDERSKLEDERYCSKA
jgi:sensor histidine kinase regulating citrate/malate metabolism